MDNLTRIWGEVSNWPADQRLALARRLLQSVQQEEEPMVARERQEALRQLVGIWKMEQPPNDAQVEQILEEERMRKYGACA